MNFNFNFNLEAWATQRNRQVVDESRSAYGHAILRIGVNAVRAPYPPQWLLPTFVNDDCGVAVGRSLWGNQIWFDFGVFRFGVWQDRRCSLSAMAQQFEHEISWNFRNVLTSDCVFVSAVLAPPHGARTPCWAINNHFIVFRWENWLNALHCLRQTPANGARDGMRPNYPPLPPPVNDVCSIIYCFRIHSFVHVELHAPQFSFV